MPKIKKDGHIHDTLTGYDFTLDTPLLPRKAIRQKCLECQCGVYAEVERCHITDCCLWPWRNAAAIRVHRTGKGRGMKSALPGG